MPPRPGAGAMRSSEPPGASIEKHLNSRASRGRRDAKRARPATLKRGEDAFDMLAGAQAVHPVILHPQELIGSSSSYLYFIGEQALAERARYKPKNPSPPCCGATSRISVRPRQRLRMISSMSEVFQPCTAVRSRTALALRARGLPRSDKAPALRREWTSATLPLGISFHDLFLLRIDAPLAGGDSASS